MTRVDRARLNEREIAAWQRWDLERRRVAAAVARARRGGGLRPAWCAGWTLAEWVEAGCPTRAPVGRDELAAAAACDGYAEVSP